MSSVGAAAVIEAPSRARRLSVEKRILSPLAWYRERWKGQLEEWSGTRMDCSRGRFFWTWVVKAPLGY